MYSLYSFIECFYYCITAWLVDNFFLGNVNLCNSFFGRYSLRYHGNTISVTVDTMSTLLQKLVSLRDGYLFLTASVG